jgi:hypothetical protein
VSFASRPASPLRVAALGRSDLLDERVWSLLSQEVITEPKGRLHLGPPKTSAGRGMVGLPRSVVDALAERLAMPGSPEELVLAGPLGGALRVPAPILAAGDPGGRCRRRVKTDPRTAAES